jgi:hypothetical protein
MFKKNKSLETEINLLNKDVKCFLNFKGGATVYLCGIIQPVVHAIAALAL